MTSSIELMKEGISLATPSFTFSLFSLCLQSDGPGVAIKTPFIASNDGPSSMWFMREEAANVIDKRNRREKQIYATLGS